eukprot:scaffold117462_cov17-Tisochrysis_lutea.AAC.1
MAEKQSKQRYDDGKAIPEATLTGAIYSMACTNSAGNLPFISSRTATLCTETETNKGKQKLWTSLVVLAGPSIHSQRSGRWRPHASCPRSTMLHRVAFTAHRRGMLMVRAAKKGLLSTSKHEG